MAKFSVSRDEDEDDDYVDEEFCARSPKRRRTCDHPHNPPSSSASNVYDHHHHDHLEPSNHPNHDHHDHQQQKISSEEDNDIVSTDRTRIPGGGSMSITLSDPDVLDCPICFEPLTIPVFQCNNGHIACSSCCKNVANKCPSCCEKIGNSRCRAIEKVIESVRVSCCYVRYGCKEAVSYCKKQEHEEKCLFAPCPCPFPNCLFRGSSRKISRHICREHSDRVVQFQYNSVFSISVGMDEVPIAFKEKKDGVLFILSHGNSVAVKCVDPILPQDQFNYDIVLRRGCSTLKFQSSTHFTTGQLSDPPSGDYVLVPGYFYQSGGRLKLDVCVWKKDALM